MAHSNTDIWQNDSSLTAVDRRVVISDGTQPHEVTLHIPPDRLVMHLESFDVIKLQQAAVPIDAGEATPHFVWATAWQAEGETLLTVRTADGKLPVLQAMPAAATEAAGGGEDLNFSSFLARAHLPLSTAVVAKGDSAIGFVVACSKGRNAAFYPLVLLETDEVETYRAGGGSTGDLIQLLPFQS